jgi:hypothetical protein
MNPRLLLQFSSLNSTPIFMLRSPFSPRRVPFLYLPIPVNLNSNTGFRIDQPQACDPSGSYGRVGLTSPICQCIGYKFVVPRLSDFPFNVRSIPWHLITFISLELNYLFQIKYIFLDSFILKSPESYVSNRSAQF